MRSKIDEAVLFAVRSHEGQTRRIVNTPYILHPLEVASIMARLTDDEDAIAAALLHDVVEDAGVPLTEIEEKFGSRVRDLVAVISENKRPDRPAGETWLVRKEESLARLKAADDPDVRKLWLSDKLSNMRSFYQSYNRMGDAVFLYFHRPERAAQSWYYRSVLEALASLSGTEAYEELEDLILRVFGEGRAEEDYKALKKKES